MKHLLFSPLFLIASALFGTIPHVYVTDQPSGTLSVIDTSSDAVQKIMGFTKPTVVKVTPDGTLAYVGSGDNTVRIVNTITNTVLPTIININQPIALAITPNAKYVYVVSANNILSVIRTSDNTIYAQLSGFNNPGDLKITPNGALVYVTNSGNGTISVINTVNNQLVNTLIGFGTPEGITFTPDGAYAYITDTSHNAVYVINTTNNTITDTLLGFDQPAYVAVTPDNTTAYVSSTGNNTISIIHTYDNAIVGSIPIPSPKSLAVTQDGLYLYIGSNLGTVFKVRIFDNRILVAIPTFKNPSNITMTTNNSPANSVNGCQVTVSQINIYNQITWNNGPGVPTNFVIYSDVFLTNQIATLPGRSTEYLHQNLEAGQSYSYYVVANYANGFSSTIGNCTVPPARVCSWP